ncbi:hypothetical protein KC340_g16034 [Hortaea werneckii]|nr:hypothetical protein KC342_g16361 [Hortaea werneckii]KAI7061833.1 hypothetical protein KC339_g16713 [Hortaea werneckii]KAI7214032.1 hypothetical protein KC365_g14070 [Hortaea werneckii]KAI7294773.1 hypothetical protein KC340_g16034 [Hortaea werneckii]KAI7380248.1 hypothetical protein KC328_g12886 [Hortaea werneckii]
MSRSKISLTDEEERFCHTVCNFVESEERTQHLQPFVEAFHAVYTQPSGNFDYPEAWIASPSERYKAFERFVTLNESITPSALPKDDHLHKILGLIMATLKRVAYFTAIGFLANLLAKYVGVQAHPGPAVVNDGPGFFFRGTHVDNTSGIPFDLYVGDECLTNESALAEFYMSEDEESNIFKRDWYDCDFGRGRYIANFCCNTGHSLGGFVSSIGSSTFGIQLSQQLDKAFDGKRDGKSPRSICYTENKKRLCTSWATYSGDVATTGEKNDITRYSRECAESGGSTEFKTTTTDGGVLFICVSNRPDGCHGGIGDP